MAGFLAAACVLRLSMSWRCGPWGLTGDAIVQRTHGDTCDEPVSFCAVDSFSVLGRIASSPLRGFRIERVGGRISVLCRHPPTVRFSTGSWIASACLVTATLGVQLKAGDASSVAFVDADVQDYASLIDSLPKDVEVVVLHRQADGLYQMAEHLAGRRELHGIHLFSHGDEAGIKAGMSWIRQADLETHQAELATIGAALRKGGDLLLYGCNIANGDSGRAFVASLADKTGADVAASQNPTGAVDRGGDWTLEFSTGSVEHLALDAARLAAFTGLLDTPVDGTTTFGNANDYPASNVDAGGADGYLVANIVNSGWDFRVYAADGTPDVSVNVEVFTGETHIAYGATNNGFVELLGISLTPNDGKLFDLNSVEITVDDITSGGISAEMTLVGYRSGSPVSGASLTQVVTQASNGGTMVAFNVSGDPDFDDIDSFRVVPGPGVTVVGAIGVDNVNVSNLHDANTSPVLANLNSDSVAWAGVGNTVTLDASANASLTDTELGALNGGNGNWSGASLTVQRSAAVSADTFGFNTSGALFTVSSNNLQSGGQTFATFTNAGGVLTINFTSSGTTATTALVNDVARRITYRNDTPAGDATIRFTLHDGTVAGTPADVTVTSDTIYVTNSTDTAVIDATNGVSFSEAVAIAAADATGSQTIVFSSSLAATALTINSVSLNESLTFDIDLASGLSLTGGTITLGAATTQTFTNGVADSVTISSAIQGNGALTKAGVGGLTLFAVNPYSGATTVSAGTLTVSGGDAISSNSSVSISAGAALALSSNEAIGNLSGAGVIVLGSNTLTTTQTANTTFSGDISGTGGLTVNQVGAATYALTLSGNNTYSGATLAINYGRVRLDGDAAISSSSQLRANGNSIVTLLSDQNVGSLSSNSANASIELGSYTLSAGGDNASTTVSGVVSGAGNLVKQGSGTMTLAGSNSYSGTTTISAGTLSVASDGNLGSDPVTLATGSTLAITGATTIDNAIALSGNATISNSADATLSGIISGGNDLTKAGASTLTLSGNNTYTGTTTVSAGTLSIASDARLGSGNVRLAAGTTLTVTDATNVDNAIVLEGNATVSTSANATLSGVISGGFNLTKTGASTLTLSGSNTYTGTTTVGAGALSLASDANLGGGALTLASGASLLLTGATTIDNNIALTGNVTFTISANATLSGVMSGGFSIAKNGASTLTLSGNNTYTGSTTVSGGALSIAGDSNLGGSAVALGAGTTLAITGSGTIDNNLILAGAATVQAASAVTWSGIISGGATLAKTGAGTLTLTGSNTASGTTTVSAGGLAVTGSTAGATTVASGATLSGTGTLGGTVTVQSGGILSPGTSPGSLTIQGDLTMDAGSTLAIEINGTTAGTQYDQLVVNGATGIGGATLSVVHGYTASAGDSHVIIVNDAADAVTGTFSGLSEGGTFTAGGDGSILHTSYAGSSGNDVVLSLFTTPAVTGVSSASPDATYKIGDTLAITVTFDEAVLVDTTGGTPALLLETGTTDRSATFASGSGTATLTFDYTVQAGDIAADLDYGSTGALSLNTGTIRNALGQDADLTLAAPGAAGSLGATKALEIDGVRPTASLVVADTALASGKTTVVTITFSEPVTGFASNDLTVANGSLSGLSSSDSGTTWTATLTPTGGVEDPSNLITLDNTGVTDAAGNTGTGTTDSNNYAVDSSPPTATIVVADTAIAAGETSQVTITFSEAVTGLTTSDLTVGSGTLADLISGDGGVTWTATLTPANGVEESTNVVTLDNTGVADAAGNGGAGTTDSNNYAVDTIVPVNTVPGAQTTTTVAPLVFSAGNSNAISVVEGGALTTVVSVGNGMLTATTGGGAAISNNGTATVTLEGTAAQVNAALEGLTYTPAGAGPQTIAVQSSDAVGNSDNDTIAVTVENTTLVVTSSLDTGDDATTAASLMADQGDGSGLSIREALHWALTGDTVSFDLDSGTAGNQGGTITLNGTQLTLSRVVTIDGDLDNDGIPDVTVSGNNASRVIATDANLSGIELTGLTLTQGNGAGGGGGLTLGINVSVTIRDCDISNNLESGWGGGGIYGSTVTITVINSTIRGNSSDSFGGGIRAVGNSILNLINSTVSGNTTTGPGAHGAGIQYAGPNLTITNTTISGNAALGASSEGGGLRISSGSSLIHNSTIVGNAATNTGGGVSANGTSDVFVNTVVAGNTAGAGAAAAAGGAPLATGGSANDVGGTIENATYSYFGTNTTITSDSGSLNNQGTANLLLGDLALNDGGVVSTHQPGMLSALVDAGSNAAIGSDTFDVDGDSDTVEPLPLDANGASRIRGGTVDIGAVEIIRNPMVASVSSTASDGSYAAGATLVVTLEFDIAVTVDTTGGTPTLALETGAIDRTAGYTGGSGSTTLSFTYTVQAGDLSPDLDYTSTTALALNGATMQSASGYDAILTLPSPGAAGSLGQSRNIVIDAVAPTVTDAAISISGATGTAGAFKVGDTVVATWNNTAGGDNNSDVASVTVDFSQFGGGAAVSATQASDTWTASFTLVAGSIEAANRTIAVSVTDAAGNVTTTADTSNATVDTQAPVITSAVIANGTYGSPFSYTITVTGSATTFGATGLPAGLSLHTGTGVISGNPTAVGDSTVTLTAEDGAGNADSTDLALSIGKAAQTVTFPPVGPITVGAPVTLVATASSGLPVTFSVVSGNGSISGTSFTANDADPIVLRASQSGNGNYTSAFAEQTVASGDITKLTQTITFAQPADRATDASAFALEATASSGLTVTFALESGPATLSGQTVTLSGAPGVVTIVASQAGNAAYAAAPSVTRSFAVTAPAPLTGFGGLMEGGQERGRFAVYLGRDGVSGTLIGHVPGQGGFVLTFTPDAAGAFTATAKLLAVGQGIQAPDTAPAPVMWTFIGQVQGTVLSGTISETGHAFSATFDPAAGPSAALSGYFATRVLDSTTGQVHAIVGTTGTVFVLVALPDLVDGGTTTIAAASGEFTLQASSGAVVDGDVDGATQTIDGSVVRSGGTATDFAGPAFGLSRTDRLVNLSSRARVGQGEEVAIGGFVIHGGAPKSVLIRAVGPGLVPLGIPAALADPRLTVMHAGSVVATNDDWGTASNADDIATAMSATGAFGISSSGKDAALLLTLQPGIYTAIVDGKDGGPGVALVEVYDATTGVASYERLLNISTRGYVGAGDDTLIGGFVITGNAPKRVLVRGVGPQLAAWGVAGALADPSLTIYARSTPIAQNDDWESGTPSSAADLAAAASATSAFALQTNGKDAAILITLAPGIYTAHVTGVDGATGIALIEIYEVP